MTEQETVVRRQRWMQVLARAGQDLLQFEAELASYEYSYIRKPETGMVMARGAMGGRGQAFNVGEVTVTRCVVRMADGAMGYSYVLGRSIRQAELAAVVDGLLQGAEAQKWFEKIIMPLQQSQQQKRQQREQEVAGSKVNFFTMVRGD